MEQCEECGFGDGVHGRGCWMTLSPRERMEIIVRRDLSTQDVSESLERV